MELKHLGAVALGVGLVGTAVLLAACGPKEQEPRNTAFDLLNKFDKDGRDGISSREAVQGWRQIVSDNYHSTRIGDHRHWSKNVYERTWDTSVRKAVLAADGLAGGTRDGNASWDELTALAASFNRDSVATLNRDEQDAFKREYRPIDTNSHRRFLYTDSGIDWNYYRDYDYPRTPGGGTSPGDTPGFPGGGGGGGTSPGDTPGGGFPSNPGGGSGGGTGGGDTGGGSGGGSGGSSGGNSTDNGSAPGGPDDF